MKSDRQLHEFTRQVCQNPRFGSLVQFLSFDKKYGSKFQAQEFLPKQFQRNVEWLTGETYDATTKSELDRQLREGSSDSWLAMLLPYLTNIKHLHLNSPICGEYFNTAIVRIAVEKRYPQGISDPPLQFLQECTVTPLSTGDSYISPRCFFPLFHLPSLRVFRARELYDETNTSQISRSVISHPKETEVKELHFQQGCYNVKGFASFIKCCKNLEVFEYQQSRRDESSLDWWFGPYHPQPIYDALVTQKKSLRVLRMDDHGSISQVSRNQPELISDDLYDGFARQEKWLGSLQGFTSLREIQLPFLDLLDFDNPQGPKLSLLDVLPPSLEYLCLAKIKAGSWRALQENVAGMLEDYQKNFPNWVTLELRPYIRAYYMTRPGGMSKDFKNLLHISLPPSADRILESVKMVCQEKVKLVVRDQTDVDIEWWRMLSNIGCDEARE